MAVEVADTFEQFVGSLEADNSPAVYFADMLQNIDYGKHIFNLWCANAIHE